MFKIKKSIFVSVCLLIFMSHAHAITSPFSLAIFPPIQFPSDEDNVLGLRLSVLWGQHKNVYGLDLGLLGSITDGDFVGTGLSMLFNIADHVTILGGQAAFVTNVTGGGSVLGAQLAGLLNANTKDLNIYGLQAAVLLNFNKGGRILGLQTSLVNLSSGMNIYGIQFALANTAAKVGGLQIGMYNQGEEVHGIQFGVVNYAKKLYGMQLGLVNIHADGFLPVFPLINIGF